MVLRKQLVFLWVLWLSLPIFADNSSKVLATRINVFRPVVTPVATKTGYCWVNSVAVSRSDVWRCMVANSIFDPCFALKSQDRVICGVDPSKNDPGFFLKLTRPLPKPLQVKSSQANVWMIELEDGQICRPYVGTMPVIQNSGKVMAVQYGCQNGENGEVNGLLEGSVVLGKIWRAKKITYVSSSPEVKVIKIQGVKIKEVWQ